MTKQNNEKRFPVLRLVIQLYKIAAIIIGAIMALSIAFTFIDGGFVAGTIAAIGAFIVWIFIYASGEILEVFLSIESNSRDLVAIQKRLLQLQQKDARKQRMS